MILKPVHLTSWGGSHTFAIWALEFAVGQSFHPLGHTVGAEWQWMEVSSNADTENACCTGATYRLHGVSAQKKPGSLKAGKRYRNNAQCNLISLIQLDASATCLSTLMTAARQHT